MWHAWDVAASSDAAIGDHVIAFVYAIKLLAFWDASQVRVSRVEAAGTSCKALRVINKPGGVAELRAVVVVRSLNANLI